MLLTLVPVVLLAQRAKEPQPDLSGTWSFSTLTALERPAEFAGKEFLTEAEAAAFARRTMERNNRDNRDPSNREATSAAPTTSSGGIAGRPSPRSAGNSARR